MKRTLTLLTGLIVGIGFLLGGIVVVKLLVSDREVLFQGRPLNHWIGELARSDNAASKLQADPAMAVPLLIGCLVREDGAGRPDVVDALAEYGPAAKGAVPRLVKLLADRSSKGIMRAVPEALKKIDPEAATKVGVK